MEENNKAYPILSSAANVSVLIRKTVVDVNHYTWLLHSRRNLGVNIIWLNLDVGSRISQYVSK